MCDCMCVAEVAVMLRDDNYKVRNEERIAALSFSFDDSTTPSLGINDAVKQARKLIAADPSLCPHR